MSCNIVMMCKWCDGVSSRSLTINGQWWFRFLLLVFSIWITFAEAKCDFRWQFVAPNRYRQAAAAEAKELSSDHILPSSDAVFIISKMLARRFCAHWNRRIKHTYTHFVISWQLQLLENPLLPMWEIPYAVDANFFHFPFAVVFNLIPADWIELNDAERCTMPTYKMHLLDDRSDQITFY